MAKQDAIATSPHMSLRIEFALHFLYLKPLTLYSRLSLNVLRAVFPYIALVPVHLAAISFGQLYVYELVSGRRERTATGVSVDLAGTGTVTLRGGTLLVVGGRESQRDVRSVDIWTGRVQQEMHMNDGRAWPGTTAYSECVYVFGGNPKSPLPSAEKFHTAKKRWKPLPNMHSPKVAFTPCTAHDWIYLPELSPSPKPLEAFHPPTERYTLFPVQLSDLHPGSLAFIVNSELIVVSHYRTVGVWPLNSESSSLRKLEVDFRGVGECYTNGTPIRCGGNVFWLDGSFRLVRYDVRRNRAELAHTV